MNIVVINGTEVRGCTYQIREFFIDKLRKGNTIKHRLIFAFCRMLHKKTVKSGADISADDRYWLEKKWI